MRTVNTVSDIGTRKEDHLELCATGDVGHSRSRTLLDNVELIHTPLPELALDEIDTTTTLLGKKLQAPLLISAMTGGTERTGRLNRELAGIAEELGIGFALGSQRPMVKEMSLTETYAVREHAPSTLIIGNLGIWQARQLGPAAVENLGRTVDADAMAIHLNPAQELVQPEGDRDFRGGYETLETLQLELELPMIVKETGCGLGPNTAKQLRTLGIEHLDVAGAGGTSWVAVETHRTEDAQQKELGQTLRDWGVPTGAALIHAVRLNFTTVIATGGIVTGLDAARAIALGADAVGIARPVLKSFLQGGPKGALQYLRSVIASLRAIMLLTGSRTLRDLRKTPRVVGPELDRWREQLD